jgi:iron complex transport system substrate-binding protein
MIRFLACLGLFFAGAASASVTVVDDAGRSVTLPAPAHRIVSLAPNITDALFAAGAGAYVLGTSRFSDYPAEAKMLPLVGDATMIDLERIVSLKTDIVVVWKSGNAASQVDKLKQLGIPLFYSETTRLAQVANTTRQLGKLAGTEAIANRNADAFDASLEKLRAIYAGKKRLKVFFQIWDRPLMTIGHAQIIDDALSLCGGDNIFADLDQAAPAVSREAVLARNPDVIMAGGGGEGDSLAGWRQGSSLTAARRGNVFVVEAPTLALPSPSILPSVVSLCRALDEARSRAGD